jgi:hypothetical protein
VKARRFIQLTFAALVALPLLTGCGHKEGDGHDHGEGEAEGHEGHGHGEESPSGASFKAGKGVMVTPETTKIMGLEVAEVTERKLPEELRFTVQVFGEKHHHTGSHDDHSGCDVHGSGLVSSEAAAGVEPGQTVQVLQGTNSPLSGVVLSVQKALALGETEIIVGLTNAAVLLKSGEFVPARIQKPRDGAVVAVPEAALLRTAEGTFVYAVNGEAYYRTAVKVGARSGGWLEITDGLLAGDAVVVKPVETLWLIELRATKGGGHSH